MFLMEPVHVRFRVLGGNPLYGSDTLVFVDGDYPWNLSLGRNTGVGKFDGETFFGWVVDVFSWGGGGGEEELQDTTPETFSQDDASSKQP